MKKLVIAVLLVALMGVIVFTGCSNTNFSITFEVDGEVYKTMPTTGKEIVPLPQNPTKVEHTFVGWFRDKDNWQQEFTANSLIDAPINRNITVYAKWEKQPELFSIFFETNGGGTVDTITLEAGEAVTQPAHPEKRGYVFKGWYIDNGTFEVEFVFNVMPAGGITLYACWVDAPK